MDINQAKYLQLKELAKELALALKDEISFLEQLNENAAERSKEVLAKAQERLWREHDTST